MKALSVLALALSACVLNAPRAGHAPRQGTGDKGAAAVQAPGGRTVYRADECIGAIVNNQCHGAILPKTANHPTCHGEMIGGQCTGPMF